MIKDFSQLSDLRVYRLFFRDDDDTPKQQYEMSDFALSMIKMGYQVNEAYTLAGGLDRARLDATFGDEMFDICVFAWTSGNVEKEVAPILVALRILTTDEVDLMPLLEACNGDR